MRRACAARDPNRASSAQPFHHVRAEGVRDSGVVDHKGEVFGYRNLYVADGAIVPKAIGLNPSRTIAALAGALMVLWSPSTDVEV